MIRNNKLDETISYYLSPNVYDSRYNIPTIEETALDYTSYHSEVIVESQPIPSLSSMPSMRVSPTSDINNDAINPVKQLNDKESNVEDFNEAILSEKSIVSTSDDSFVTASNLSSDKSSFNDNITTSDTSKYDSRSNPTSSSSMPSTKQSSSSSNYSLSPPISVADNETKEDASSQSETDASSSSPVLQYTPMSPTERQAARNPGPVRIPLSI